MKSIKSKAQTTGVYQGAGVCFSGVALHCQSGNLSRRLFCVAGDLQAVGLSQRCVRPLAMDPAVMNILWMVHNQLRDTM